MCSYETSRLGMLQNRRLALHWRSPSRNTRMASQEKMHGSSASISEAKDKTIVVGNLPQDAKRELLQCLFPEAVKIFMDMDEYRSRKRGTSLIVFPKVKNALFYTDKNHSIKLDSRHLSIRYLGPQSTKIGGGGGGGGAGSGGGNNSVSGGNKPATAPGSNQPKIKPRSEPPPKANPQPDPKPKESEDDKIVVIQNLPKGIGKIGVLQIIPTAKKVNFKGPPKKSKFESALLEFNTIAQANAVIKKNGQLRVGDHTLFIESMTSHKRRPKNQLEGPFHEQTPPKSSNEAKDRGGGGGNDKSNQQKMAQGAMGSGPNEDKRFVFMSKRGGDQQQSLGPEMGQYEKDLTNLFNFPKAGTNPAALQYGLAALENLLSRAAKMGMNELKSLLTANPRLHQLFAENQDFQPRLQKLFAHNQDFQPQLKRLFAANQVFLPKLQMLIAASNQQQQSKENLNFNMGSLGPFGPHGPLRPQGHPMGPPQGSMRPPSGSVRPPQGSGRMMQGPGGPPMSMQEQQAFKKEMMVRQQRRMYSAARGAADDEEEEEEEEDDNNERGYREEQGFGNARNFPGRDGGSGPWPKQDEGRSQPHPRMFDEEPGFPFRRRMNFEGDDDDRRPPSQHHHHRRQQQQQQQQQQHHHHHQQHQQKQPMFTEEMEEFAEKQRVLYDQESENRDRPPASPSSKRRMFGANEDSMYSEDQALLHSGRQQGFYKGRGGGDDDDFAPPHKRRAIYVDEPERGGPNRHQRPFGGGGGGDNLQDFNEGPRMYGAFGGSGGGGGRDNFGGGGGGGGGRDNFGGGGGGGGGRDNFGGGGGVDPSNQEGGGFDGSRNREYPGSRPYDEFRHRGGGGNGGGGGGRLGVEDDRMGGDAGGRKSREMFDENMDFPNRNPKMFGHNEPFHSHGGSDSFSGSMMPPQQSNLDTSAPGPSIGETKLNYVSFDYNHQHSNVPLTDMEPFSNNPGNFSAGGAGSVSPSSMMGQDSGNNAPYDRHGPSMSRSAGGDDGNQFGQRGMEPSGPGFDNEMDQSYSSRDDQFGQRPPQFGVGSRNLKSALKNSSAYRFEDSSMSAGNSDQGKDVHSGDFGSNNNNNRMSDPSENPDSGRGFRDRDHEERDTFMGTWRSPLGMGNYQQERGDDVGRPGSGFGDDISGNRQMDDTASVEQQQMSGSGSFHGNMDRGGFQYGGNARGQSDGGEDFPDWGRQRDGENEGFGVGRDSSGGAGDSGRRMQMGESHDYGHKSSEGYNRYYGSGGGGGGGGGGGSDSLGDDRPSYPSRGANKNNDDDIEDPGYNVKWGQGVGSLDRGSSRERSWMSRGDPADYRRVEDDNNNDDDDRGKGAGYGFQSDSENRGSHLYEDNWQQSGDYRHHDSKSDYPGDGAGGHRIESSFRRGVSYGRDEDLEEPARDEEAPYYRSGRSVAFERDNYSYNEEYDNGGNESNTNVDEGGYYSGGGAAMEQNLSDDRESYRRQERYGEQKMEEDFEQDGSDPPLGWRSSSSKQDGSDPPLGWRSSSSKQDGSDPPLGWRNPGSKQDGSDPPLGWRNPASKQDGPDPPLGWRNHKYFSSSPSKSDPPSSSRRGRDDAEGGGSWERNQRGSGYHGDRSGGEQGHRRGRSSRSNRSYGRNSNRDRAGSRYGGGGGGGRGSYGDASEGDANTGGGSKEDQYGQDTMRKVVMSRDWKGDGGGGGEMMRRHHKQSRWN